MSGTMGQAPKSMVIGVSAGTQLDVADSAPPLGGRIPTIRQKLEVHPSDQLDARAHLGSLMRMAGRVAAHEGFALAVDCTAHTHCLERISTAGIGRH